MEQKIMTEAKDQNKKDGMVHFILSNSYTVFLLAVILGVILDMIIPINTFSDVIYQYLGAIMVILGSCLIYWAQSSTKRSKVVEDSGQARDFMSGPYKYSRNPTHIGLTIMAMGLAFIINSPFSLILTIMASLITKAIFLRKEESLLEKKYGQPYSDYKKKVGSWI